MAHAHRQETKVRRVGEEFRIDFSELVVTNIAERCESDWSSTSAGSQCGNSRLSGEKAFWQRSNLVAKQCPVRV